MASAFRFGRGTGRAPRGRKVKVPAGRSFRSEDFVESSDDCDEPDAYDKPSEIPSTSSTATEGTSALLVDGGHTASSSSAEEPVCPSVGGFYIVQFPTEKKGRWRKFVGKIVEIEGSSVKVKCMRRDARSTKNVSFIFPIVEDICTVKTEQLCKVLSVCSSRRDRFSFLQDTTGAE